MKPFYSLIKVSPNPSAGDLFTVGIIVVNRTGVRVKVSDNKLKIIRRILDDKYPIVDFAINQIINKIHKENTKICENETLLFDRTHLFQKDYFTYLNKYSHNLVQFTKPIDFIDKNDSQENLEGLFSLLVDSKSIPELSMNNNEETLFIDRIDRELVSRVKDRVHTNYSIDDKIIPSLYFRLEMDCIGSNGVITGAKSLYFDKHEKTIHTQVSDYITFITEIEKKYQKEGNNNFYLISDEPEKGSKEHLLWGKVRSLKKIKLITSSDSSQVAEEIEKNNSQTFLPIQ